MDVIYEDNHIIVVNKTCTEIVQADKTGDKPLCEVLQDYLKQKYNKPGNVFIGVTHRLDRPTSGLVVFAKTSKALSRMNDLFRSHDLKKTYWAIVKNLPPMPSGRLENFLARNEKLNKSFVVADAGSFGAKRAVLNYRVLLSANNYHLVEVDLQTGRHHQIRCQLANIGCPIKGDLKYGADRSNPDGGISLHARSIEFLHPVSHKLLHLVAPVPADNLWQAFNTMAQEAGLDSESWVKDPPASPASPSGSSAG